MKNTKINIIRTCKLKYTLYPNYDEYYDTDKEEWDRDSGHRVLRKGSIFNIVSKEDYCKIRKYEGEELERFINYSSDFDYVAYMKSNHKRHMLINSLDVFEVINDGLLIFK